MRKRTLGPLEVSVVGLGCNNFGRRVDEERTRVVVDAALEAGVTFFDTAESYGGGQSEAFLGSALHGRRDQVLLATKFGGGSGGAGKGSRDEVRRALEGSLERLRTDYVDLYQHHQEDPRTPLSETIGALDELVREARFGRTAPPTTRRRNWKRRRQSPRDRTSRSRASTRGSSARPNASCCRPASASGSVSSPTSRSRAAS
jgi:aryl-alcohol dehydrogenase-like predicted oxidoreductase